MLKKKKRRLVKETCKTVTHCSKMEKWFENLLLEVQNGSQALIGHLKNLWLWLRKQCNFLSFMPLLFMILGQQKKAKFYF